jgi:hypothetical protein
VNHLLATVALDGDARYELVNLSSDPTFTQTATQRDDVTR